MHPDTAQEHASLVDAHAHWFPASLDLIESQVPFPRLVIDDETSGRIMRGEAVFRPVKAPLWSLDDRVRELDLAGVALQAISPVPVMFSYDAPPGEASAYCAAVNDALAKDVAESAGRLVGLGMLPLQSPGDAVAELERCMSGLGLAGVEIGTTVGGVELDDPSLTPFWEAAERYGASVFIHPVDGGGGAIRRGGQPYDFGLGMLTDTAMAASALVFGGVLERFPRLRVGMAHGCGTFGWAYPRLRRAHQQWGDGPVVAVDQRMRSLWVDTLVLDPEHLRLLVDRFGPDKVMVGTDYPFFPDVFVAAGDLVPDAAHAGIVPAGDVRSIVRDNALAFLGVSLERQEHTHG